MSAPFHVDCPVPEFAVFYAKLQLLLANFVARPCGPCKSMLEHFLIQHGATLERAYAFKLKVPALQAFIWSIVYTLNAHLTHVPPSTSPESRQKEIMMAAKARILDANFSAARVAKIFYPSLNGGESTNGCGNIPPTAGPVPDNTSLPATCSRLSKGKEKVATLTPPPSTSQKRPGKPSLLESKDNKLNQLEISPKIKPGAPSGSRKPNTSRGKTGGSQAKPKDPLAPFKDKKQACSPSPERTAPKPNKVHSHF
ncbi:hypothetical protein L218DRAFT_1003303 [Marasmius fiardii PR-910]|nr:hypothetical protein L218DRAFT_1003303 [Marasmius fiardii PR-910]